VCCSWSKGCLQVAVNLESTILPLIVARRGRLWIEMETVVKLQWMFVDNAMALQCSLTLWVNVVK